jgi:hypothetical protein
VTAGEWVPKFLSADILYILKRDSAVVLFESCQYVEEGVDENSVGRFRTGA